MSIPYTGTIRGLPWTTTHSPAGLWLFDGDSLDSSGNGRNLVLAQGSETYVVNSILPESAVPGYGGFAVYAPFDTRYTVTDAVLSASGDVTLSMLIYTTDPTDAAFEVGVQCGTSPNIRYRLGWNHAQYNWFWQDSGGGSITGSANTRGPRRFGWNAITCRRQDNGDGTATGAGFVNGVKLDERTVNSAGSGGGVQSFHVFNDSTFNNEFVGLCAGVAMYPSVLTDAQIVELHRRVLPMYVDQAA